MANAKVPLKFQIFKGDELLTRRGRQRAGHQGRQAGLLASAARRRLGLAHARGDRGQRAPTTCSSSTSGSTRGTLVNGERITKVRLPLGRRDQLRRRPGDRELPRRGRGDGGGAARVGGRRRRSPQARPMAPPPAYAPPSRRRHAPPPAAAYAPPPPTPAPPPTPPLRLPATAAAPATPAAAWRRSPACRRRGANPVAAEVEVHDGTRAIEVQALFRGRGDQHPPPATTRAPRPPPARPRGMLVGGIAALLVAFGDVRRTP